MADDFGFEAIFAELAPTTRRWLRAARVALITGLGAGLMATMQIANPLGLTLLVNLALPEAAFPLRRAVGFLCCAALFQILALAVAAALADSPALNLAAFILLSLVSSYLIYAVPILGRLWLWIQVPVVTAFYMVLFVPAELGWDNAQIFAGLAIAVALLLLFNNLIWPEPIEAVRGGSLAEALEHSRSRFRRVMAIAVGDAAPDENRPPVSRLGHHIALLSQAGHRASGPVGSAQLLSAVMSAERIHNQIERIASLLLNAPGALSGLQPAVELHELGGAIDQRFEHRIRHLYQRVVGRAGTTDGLSPSTMPTDLNLRLARIAHEYPELARLLDLIGSLATLLDDELLDLPREEDQPEALAHPSIHGSNPFLVRFAVRHTLALVFAFLLGLWDNTPALHAAIWLLMLGGPPSHGATVRKFTVRALGSSGALALAALGTIIVAPNYTSLAPYIAAIFAGTFLMTYIGEGGGILSYLAIGGTAFVIAYSGPGPRSDVLESIWSVWGISVGMIIRAAATLLWREHSYRTLAEEFQAPLAAILELARGAESASHQPNRAAAAMMVVRSIQVMLGVANDAQLEGRSAGIDPANLLDTLDTLLQLAFVLAKAGRLVKASGEPEISPSVLNAIRCRLEAWLGKLNAETESGTISPAPLRRMVNEAIVPALDGIPRSDEANLPDASIRAELDGRAINLMRTLEQQLTAISLNR
jgi:hypothetical protein